MNMEQTSMGAGNEGRRKPKRVCVVNSHPIQYFAPLYAFLNTDPDIDVEVLYLSDCSVRGEIDAGFGQTVKWDIDLLDGYPSRFAGKNARTVVPGGFFSLIAPSLFGEIRRGKYDAVLIHGYAHAANLIALAAAKSAGIPVWMRTETHEGLSRDKTQSFFLRQIKKAIFRICDRFLAIGTLNLHYYLSMGVPQARISLVPYAVDNQRFAWAARMDIEQRTDIRCAFGIRGDKSALLFASKFIERKKPHHVIRAAGELSTEGLDFDLVMAGSGEMEGELRELAAKWPALRVVFPGFVNQRDMPNLLGAADGFVFPTTEEPWGLIVNEAMAAGSPVIVGREAGCVPDLVHHGQNGFVVDPDDMNALKDAMRVLITDRQARARMSSSSVEIAGRWSYSECHDGWRDALGLAKRSGNAAFPASRDGE